MDKLNKRAKSRQKKEDNNSKKVVEIQSDGLKFQKNIENSKKVQNYLQTKILTSSESNLITNGHKDINED